MTRGSGLVTRITNHETQTTNKGRYKTMMKGWKTWLAAAISILYGVGGWIAGIHGPDVMMSFVVAGIGMVGIGHKIEKMGGTK